MSVRGILVGFGFSACLPFSVLCEGAPDIIFKTNAHPNITSSLCFSHDSGLLVSGSYTGAAKLWRISDSDLVLTFNIPADHVIAVACSPNGNQIVGGGVNGRLRIWRADDGEVVRVQPSGPSAILGLSYAPNGMMLAEAYAESGNIRIASPPTGEQIHFLEEAHAGGVRSLDFSRDNTLLASGGDDFTAKVWRVSDGSLFREWAHPARVNAVGISPDGATVAVGLFAGDCRLWNVANQTVRILPSGETCSLKYSPDGQILLTASQSILKFWRVSDGKLLVWYDQETQGAATSVDISRDGKLFAYGRGDGTVVVARIPLYMSEISRSGDQLILRWQGGTGRYQLQQRVDLTSGEWQNASEPTTDTSFTATVSGGTVFYRVQSLPTP